MRFALLLVALAACHHADPVVASHPGNDADPGTSKPATAELARQLAAGELGDLFVYPAHDQTIAAIWALPGNPAALDAVIDDPASPGRARFVAAEVLFARDPGFLDRHDRGALAAVYVEALVGRWTGHANAWGFLEADSSPGEAGARFLAFGDAAVPALTALLDDRSAVDWYEGSEEATVGNGYRYRICDFAAWYLARIIGYALPHFDTPGPRDAANDALRAELAKRAR